MKLKAGLAASAVLIAAALFAALPSGAAARTKVHLSLVKLGGCNQLSYGYEVNGRLHKLGDNSRFACTPDPPVLRDKAFSVPSGGVEVLLWLRDETCGTTYFSDGSGDANHATVTSVGLVDFPYQVDIADGNTGCGDAFLPRIPGQGQGNLDLLTDYYVGL